MDRKALPTVRSLIVIALLLAAALFISARRRTEVQPSRQQLASFPVALAGWRGFDVSIDPEIRSVLGAGDILERLYRRGEGDIPVDLFVAYFPSQRTGTTIHSPKHCLPGSGWEPVSSSQVEIASNGNRATINRYVIAKGSERQVVYYWYQSQNRIIASEYTAKMCLVADAIRRSRTDAALVRVTTPVLEESMESAQMRGEAFVRQLMPQLTPYIPE